MTSPKIYTLSLHDALPISSWAIRRCPSHLPHPFSTWDFPWQRSKLERRRSEEHTSELQSHSDIVCRLLLEKTNSRTRAAGRWRYSGAAAMADCVCCMIGDG